MNLRNVEPILLESSSNALLLSSLRSLSLFFRPRHNLPTRRFNSVIKVSGGNCVIISTSALLSSNLYLSSDSLPLTRNRFLRGKYTNLRRTLDLSYQSYISSTVISITLFQIWLLISFFSTSLALARSLS